MFKRPYFGFARWLTLVTIATAVTVGLLTSMSIAPAQAQARYFYLVSRHSGKCAQVNGISPENGAPISLWDCLNLPHFKWEKVDAGGGLFYLKAKHSEKCLQVNDYSYNSNWPISQYTCVGSDNEKWRQVDVGSGWSQLVVQHSGMCLHVPGAGTANGTALTQYPCITGATNEHWRLMPAPA